MIAGDEGFASLAFRRGRIASCPLDAAAADDPGRAVCAFRCARDRAPDLFASAGLHRRRGGGAARQPSGRPLQEPLPQGQEGRVLARGHARGTPDRPEEAGGAAGGAALFVWRRRRSSIGFWACGRGASRLSPSSTMPSISSRRCSTPAMLRSRPAQLPPAGKRSHDGDLARRSAALDRRLAGTCRGSSIWPASSASRIRRRAEPIGPLALVFAGRCRHVVG